MKKGSAIVFIITLVSFACITVQAAQRDSKDKDSAAMKLSSYHAGYSYQGPFKTKEVFIRGEGKVIWYLSSQFNKIDQITCREASSALRNEGTWIGNLDDNGQCLDPGEAPEWTSGNYLNYLTEKNKARRLKGSATESEDEPQRDNVGQDN